MNHDNLPVDTGDGMPPMPAFRLVLLDGLKGASLLKAGFPGINRKIKLELPPRHTRLLVAIVRSQLADEVGSNDNADGWRTKKQLARMIEDSWEYRVAGSTITSYASQISTAVEKELNSVGIRLTFLERRRGYGVRLGPGFAIEIIDKFVEPDDEQSPKSSSA